MTAWKQKKVLPNQYKEEIIQDLALV